MNKISEDKRKTKPLSMEVREKYKAMLKVSRSTKNHFKNLAAKCEKLNEEYRVIIKHHEWKLDNIEAPAGGISSPDPQVKKLMAKLQQDVELSQEIIREYKHRMSGNNELIKLSKIQARVYWRHEKRYNDLLLAKRTRKKKT